MEYFLMRKDEVVTICDFADNGTMISYSPNFRNPELAPLEHRASESYLYKWWENRQIPIRQGRVADMLKERGIIAPGEYLLRNLGLSLTDYYWINPVGSSLRWTDVNLFDNNFRENLMISIGDTSRGRSLRCTPNSSLKGELEKSWMIRNGRRVLVKGNHGSSSTESINEVVATEFHRRQGYDNFTPYKLIRIKDKPYDYGCYSEAFTSNDIELVSAYALLTSERKPQGISDYEFLIDIAARSGADREQLRHDLEYQIASDYILSNVDRHMDNIGFLRDADTLRTIRMAPIFDTGRAFGGRGVTPYSEEEIDSMEINSFENRESCLLDYITDRTVLDISNLLPVSRIEAMHLRDSKSRPGQIRNICRLYEKKIERFAKWQGMQQD